MNVMIWTAPVPAPPPEGPLAHADREILEGYLAWERHSLLNICAGLTAEQLALRPVPPSNLSLQGVVRHLTKVERTWFRIRVAGQDLSSPYDPDLGPDADFEDVAATRAEADLARYVEECRLAAAAVAERPLEATFVLRDEEYSLRFVYVHMIAEYARHNGHADLLRQAIDGVTGR
jgi:uncharacterized damage-inducible protein DinB